MESALLRGGEVLFQNSMSALVSLWLMVDSKAFNPRYFLFPSPKTLYCAWSQLIYNQTYFDIPVSHDDEVIFERSRFDVLLSLQINNFNRSPWKTRFVKGNKSVGNREWLKVVFYFHNAIKRLTRTRTHTQFKWNKSVLIWKTVKWKRKSSKCKTLEKQKSRVSLK